MLVFGTCLKFDVLICACFPEQIGSIDFVEKGTGAVVFRTCDAERDGVVFQMGTSDAVRALTAAQIV